MRKNFLLASMASAGHVNPLRPIARALVERGHAVRWYTGDEYRAAVEASGARFVPVRHERPDLDSPRSDGDGLTGLPALRFGIKHAFLDPAPGQVADLRRLLAEEPADVLVAEFAVLGARMVHELTGVPWVSVGVSPLTIPSRDTAPFGLALPPSTTPLGRLRNRALNTILDRVLLRDVRVHRDMILARVGLPPARYPILSGVVSPLLHLQTGIAELEYPRSDLPAQLHFVGALMEPSGRTDLPPWADEIEAARVPVVHVTQGTVADADLAALVLPTIHALADEDVLVVAGTGRHDPAALGPLPANARVASFVPHGWLLPHTAVMVTNGGFGGVQVALANGVPLVVAGATEDKPEVAARVAWAGVGANLATNTPTSTQIRDAVRLVLRDRAYAERAAAMRDVYAKLDAGRESAALIEALAETRLPVTRRWAGLARR
jgi:UDP:flavonoid glycosyltransferase YjiC (YdhE family)